MNPVFSNIHDAHNIGDKVCCPADYFDEFKEMDRVNLWDSLEPFENQDMIIGGGGVIHGELATKLANLSANGRKLIAWGIGHNQHVENKLLDYGCLDNFSLIGTRDWHGIEKGGNFNFVPCASCLHPEFDRRNLEPSHDFVVYEHHEHPIEIDCPMKIDNDFGEGMFRVVLDFISIGRTVITNTYHGAYWAMLLNRPVLIWKPFSTRFHAFKYQPGFVDESNWKEKLAKSEPLPVDYLKECREYNLSFYAKVKEVLSL